MPRIELGSKPWQGLIIAVILHPLKLVPEAGLEPARYFYRGILSPLCLPIPPLGQNLNIGGKGGIRTLGTVTRTLP